METTTISIKQIKTNHKFHAREFHKIEKAIKELKLEYLDNPTIIPPIKIVQYKSENYLADGYQRLKAATAAGLKEIEAIIITASSENQILIESLKSNSRNSIRLTDEQKRKAVYRILYSEDYKSLPNTQIAAICAVSEGLIRKIKKEFNIDQEKKSIITPKINKEPKMKQAATIQSTPLKLQTIFENLNSIITTIKPTDLDPHTITSIEKFYQWYLTTKI